MRRHSGDDELMKWHLEAVTQHFSIKFSTKHIIVVKPSRYDALFTSFSKISLLLYFITLLMMEVSCTL